MKVNIYSLIIEVTRMCNLNCGHCLRGESQDIKIPLEYVETLFDQIDSIGVITFTGGEPFLYPEIISEVVKIADRKHVEIGNFYIATNGTVPFKKASTAIIELWNYCGENENSQIKISDDSWHRAEDENNWRDNLIAEWELLKIVLIETTDHSLLLEGNAAFYYDEGRKLTKEKIDIKMWDNTIGVENTVYLNCLGNIIYGCDWSYDSQDNREDILWCHCSGFKDSILKEVERIKIEEMEEAV